MYYLRALFSSFKLSGKLVQDVVGDEWRVVSAECKARNRNRGCLLITDGNRNSTWDSDHMEWQMSVIRKAPDEYLKYYLSNLEKMT